MQQLNELQRLMGELNVDADAFHNKGNKAAARRARKALQEISKVCKTYRKDISNEVNAQKVQ